MWAARGRAAVAVVAGHVWSPSGGFAEGWLRHDGARVVERGEGAPPEAPAARGLVLPAPVNAHTHVGDRVARGRDLRGLTLAQVVAPPDGLKHRILRETPREALLAGMRAAMRELGAAGARSFLDFREGGADGATLLREAAGGALRPRVLGRAGAAWEEDEMRRVLEVADGLGLSALADVKGDAPERAAAAARRAGKIFALHFSEDKREDVSRALALRPSFLVHATRCERADLRAIADAGVPIVLCPRSNALFGPLPDLPAMRELGIPLALGSDNAMFHELDVLQDARLLARAFPEASPDALLAALAGGPLRERGDEDVVVLEGGDPRALWAGAAPPRVLWRSWGKVS